MLEEFKLDRMLLDLKTAVKQRRNKDTKPGWQGSFLCFSPAKSFIWKLKPADPQMLVSTSVLVALFLACLFPDCATSFEGS
jgi:hypothetical protein